MDATALTDSQSDIDMTAATTFRIYDDPLDESPFAYVDTATSRAGIGELSARIAGQNIGIVGLGGTGGYILDLVSKTPVRRIHLFDDDRFLQHNAFRAPGAVSADELASRRSKVEHFDAVYSKVHRGIVPHAVRMGPTRFTMLDDLDFVFICIDQPDAKRALVEHLEARDRRFIDVGIGLDATDRGLTGIVRVTTSTPMMRDHVWDRGRIPMVGGGEDDAYSTNVQLAELNALNAAMAVIRWKRLCGFYVDLGREHFAAYAIDGNHIVNEDVGSA